LEWLGFSVEIKARLTRIELSELSTYYYISIPTVLLFSIVYLFGTNGFSYSFLYSCEKAILI
jgi:FtsH-binding integral membrane protein